MISLRGISKSSSKKTFSSAPSLLNLPRKRGKIFASSVIRSCGNSSTKRSKTMTLVILGDWNCILLAVLSSLQVKLQATRSCNNNNRSEFSEVSFTCIKLSFLSLLCSGFASHSAVFEKTKMHWFSNAELTKGPKFNKMDAVKTSLIIAVLTQL